uniref:Uncharacterized protein n=1 Tax=Anguilla anguilla TaxID=7936 RepID=A0A0E9XS47_ANGAN
MCSQMRKWYHRLHSLTRSSHSVGCMNLTRSSVEGKTGNLSQFFWNGKEISPLM